MGPKSVTENTRKGAYQKLLCRFYEPLILLRVLGQTRGPHTSAPLDASATQSSRRRLLRNLSYLCDYEKGGESTSSIGLEENDQCFVFWAAANTARARGRIKGFLKSSLAEVRRIIKLEEEQRPVPETAFIRTCIQFAKQRVRKEIKLLSTSITRCEKYLDGAKPEDSKLETWLSQFTTENFKSVEDMCFQTYNCRRTPEMTMLENKIPEHHRDSSVGQHIDAFAEVRHRLGRLAYHVRAPKEVIKDASELDHLFDVYDICSVEPRPSNPRPQPDSLTELHSILKRMLPAGEPKLEEYKMSLGHLDQKFEVAERVRQQYKDENFQPCIHAEIQVLEHFCTNKLSFVDDDSYIGCSKPACYCCHLYFRFHRSKPVEPESHQKIYLNWGVPDLPNGAQDPGYNAQRDLMNKMVEVIRQEALAQIINKAGPPKWHADSHTGITNLTAAVSTAVVRPGEGFLEFERQSATLSFDSNTLPKAISGMESPPSSETDDDFDSDSDSDGGAAL